MNQWTVDNIPDMSGKIAVVTGGNAGLGHKTSLELARRGAQVVMACRSLDKGQVAEEAIRKEVPEAMIETISLDLIDSDSIEMFAKVFRSRHNQLHLLVNNAAVVNLERLQRTSAGHEMHMATNHLGHFALTGRLFPLLTATDRARVVTVSSGGYRFGVIDFDDLAWEKRTYNRTKAYGDSKLANLLFMRQLQKRFDSVGASAISVAAHPGLTGTERQQSIGVGGFVTRWLASPVSMGCLPQLFAATDPSVKGGDFYGPRYLMRGYPSQQNRSLKSLDMQVAAKLWQISEELTQVRY